MHPLSLPCLALCGVDCAVGSFYLLLYARRTRARENLPFALLCFALAAYDVFCAGLYSASSLSEGIGWQRAQLLCLGVVSMCSAWFLGLITEGRLNRFVWCVIVAFGLLELAVVVFDGPGFTLSTLTPAIKTMRWGGRTIVTYYESQTGVLDTLGFGLSYLTYAYFLRQVYRAHRAGRGGHLVAVMVGQLAYFAGLLNDGLVASGVYVFIYVSEYTYQVVVLAMAYALLSTFVDLHMAAERAKSTLEERVEEALADIKTLRGLIPICASCKRIRDDQGFWSQLEVYISEHSGATFSHCICPECIRQLYPRADPVRGQK